MLSKIISNITGKKASNPPEPESKNGPVMAEQIKDQETPRQNEPSGGIAGQTKNQLSGSIDPEIDEMFRLGVHYGYSRTRRHPKMQQYIFGLKNNVEIFDLERTRAKLREAEDFLRKLSPKKGVALLVGSKPSVSSLIEKAGQELGMPYSAKRWPGGLLTNFGVIRKRIDYFEELKTKKSSGELAKYTKKEQLVFDEEISRLEQKFGGLASLKKLPDALIFVDPREEKTAVREARQLGIKTIGVASSDCDPDSVTYVIPANDSASSSVKYILGRLVKAYKEGLVSAAETENQTGGKEASSGDGAAKETKKETKD